MRVDADSVRVKLLYQLVRGEIKAEEYLKDGEEACISGDALLQDVRNFSKGFANLAQYVNKLSINALEDFQAARDELSSK